MKSKLLLLLLLAPCTWAADGVPSQSTLMGQTALGLLFVVGLILALFWLAKKLNVSALAGKGQLKALAVLPLGTREKAVLIEVGSEKILLGVAPGRVNTLHVISQAVANEAENVFNSVSATPKADTKTYGSDLENSAVELDTKVAASDKSQQLMTDRQQLDKKLFKLSASSPLEFSKKLNEFLSQGNKSL